MIKNYVLKALDTIPEEIQLRGMSLKIIINMFRIYLGSRTGWFRLNLQQFVG